MLRDRLVALPLAPSAKLPSFLSLTLNICHTHQLVLAEVTASISACYFKWEKGDRKTEREKNKTKPRNPGKNNSVHRNRKWVKWSSFPPGRWGNCNPTSLSMSTAPARKWSCPSPCFPVAGAAAQPLLGGPHAAQLFRARLGALGTVWVPISFMGQEIASPFHKV